MWYKFCYIFLLWYEPKSESIYAQKHMCLCLYIHIYVSYEGREWERKRERRGKGEGKGGERDNKMNGNSPKW